MTTAADVLKKSAGVACDGRQCLGQGSEHSVTEDCRSIDRAEVHSESYPCAESGRFEPDLRLIWNEDSRTAYHKPHESRHFQDIHGGYGDCLADGRTDSGDPIALYALRIGMSESSKCSRP